MVCIFWMFAFPGRGLRKRVLDNEMHTEKGEVQAGESAGDGEASELISHKIQHREQDSDSIGKLPAKFAGVLLAEIAVSAEQRRRTQWQLFVVL